MISGATKQAFSVPYGGNIVAIGAKEIAELQVPETQSFHDQQLRISNAGIDADCLPSKEGLIAICEPSQVQPLYDAVFGSGEVARKMSNIFQLPVQTPAASNDSVLSSPFNTSAAKARLGIDFPMAAARAPMVADNSNAPSLQLAA